MKTATVILALVGTALAENLPVDAPTRVKRDAATVSSVVAQVSGAIGTLDNSVKSWNGGDPGQVQSNSDSLLRTLNSGADAIKQTSPLTVQDALGLQSASSALSGSSQTLVNDLTAKKTQFENAGLCGAIRTNLGQINTATQNLVNQVVQKLPTEVQNIAKTILGQVQSSLDQGNAAFSTTNCTDRATGPRPSSASSGAPAATPSRSAAPSASPAPPPAGRPNGTAVGTGRPPTVTAAAAMNAAGPAAMIAGVFAAVFAL